MNKKNLKKLTLLCLLTLCAWTSARAWHEYQPMVVEGRRWDVGGSCYIIKGDTILDGKAFKKVYLYYYINDNPNELEPPKLFYALREEGRKVYVMQRYYKDPEQWYENLACDFSLGVLNTDNQELSHQVFNAFNTVIQGEERRFVGVAWHPYALMGLVEGVGYLDNSLFGSVVTCSDGDKLLYNIETDCPIFEAPNWGYIPVINGEVNGDERVDIGDINAAINMMLGKTVEPQCDDVAADMDLSGTLDIADINAVINAMLGQ